MAEWTPSVEAVHAVIPTRNLGDPFDETSIPSESDVINVINGVMAEISAEVGTITDATAQAAQWAATLGAAYYVEAGLFPEQQSDPLAPAGRLFVRYREQVERLKLQLGPAAGRSFTGAMATPLTSVRYPRILDAEEPLR